MNHSVQVGENIKKWRMFRGIKQEHLASKIGVSRITLSKYEKGRTKISVIMLSEIAKSLDRTLEELTNL